MTTTATETFAAERERIAQAIETRLRELVRTSVPPSQRSPWENATATALREAAGIARAGTYHAADE